MHATISAPVGKSSSPRFVKANVPILIKPEPTGTYFGRCKVHGKLVQQFLETKDFKVAKTKVRQWLIDFRASVNARESNIRSLVEEYQRRP